MKIEDVTALDYLGVFGTDAPEKVVHLTDLPRMENLLRIRDALVRDPALLTRRPSHEDQGPACV
jgi:hypothetical protein